MDGINVSLPGAKYVEYNGKQFLDITGQIVKMEGTAEDNGLNCDPADFHVPTELEKMSAWNSYFSSAALLSSPVSDVYKEVKLDMTDAIDQFLDGRLSADKLAETFQSSLSKLTDACAERGYPTPLGAEKYSQESLADNFLRECRTKLLDAAVQRNNQEGEQYAANGKDGFYQYYNADYYYQCKDGIDALTGSVMAFCHDKGYDEFQLSDGKQPYQLEVWPPLYDDFNSAWAARNGSMTFLDVNQAPPKGFKWFQETGGVRCSTDGVVWGVLKQEQNPDETVFDASDSRSSRMWASYKGEDGKEYRTDAVFWFGEGAAALKNVAALLAFTGNDGAQQTAMNVFLKNIQVFPYGYFSQNAGKVNAAG